MNSRGIKLTFQEKIRAEIIAKHGLGIGEFWEDAQQYFWNKKLSNKDSELGFDEKTDPEVWDFIDPGLKKSMKLFYAVLLGILVFVIGKATVGTIINHLK